VSTNFVQLGSVAEFINGAAFKPEDWNGSGPRIIRIQNLTDPSKPYNRTDRTVDDKLRVRPGELLVSWSATLGVFEWMGPDDGVLNQHIFRVVPDKSKVAKSYLRHALEGALIEMQRHLHGATMQHVNRGEFLATKLFLPALAEQRRIADVLDRAEALRAKRRAALAHLDTLTESIFFNLFGDPATNPKGWELLRLQDVLSMPLRNGLSPSNVGKVTAKVLTLSAITGNEFDDKAWKVSTFRSPPPSDQSVDENDFLICRGNGNVRLVGKGYFPTRRMPDVTFPDTMIAARIRADRLERSFLQHIWGRNAVRRQVESLARTTNGTFKVNQTMLEGITFIGPPLELQREFACRVGAADNLKGAQRSSLAALDALFAVLQHRAFRGEL
jgi:type I restriction enzyme S subunit